MSEPRRITERYRLEKRISSKDTGSVFRAVDTLSGETVAVKLINAGEERRAPFEACLAALRDAHHPALPRILDSGLTPAGGAFLVTEYLAGDDLADLKDAPPARILSLLLQLAEGLEALASRGLTLHGLSTENLRITRGPGGEQVKIIGLGGTALQTGNGTDSRAGLRAFAQLAVRALGLPPQPPGEDTIALPLEIAGALLEPERLREILNAALNGEPGGRVPDWKEVRQALHTALFGETGGRPVARMPQVSVPPLPAPPPLPAAAAATQAPRLAAWEEVRLGQGPPPVPWEGEDATLAVERLGPAPETRPAPPAVPDLTTRVIRPEELEPAPAPQAAAPPLPPPAPPAAAPRTEPPAAPPPPLPAPVASPPVVHQPAPAPVSATGAPRLGKGLRLGILIGVPVALFLVVLGLVAWMSRRSARPEPPQPVQAEPARPAPKPSSPPPAPMMIHAQILLAEEALNVSDLAAARRAIEALLPEQIALFTAEEKDRYQRVLAALTPMQSPQWAGSLTQGLKTGDLRLLRAVVAAPPDAASLTPEQKKDLARARKILDLDSKLSKARRAKNHPDTLRQARLLLAELPQLSYALQARNEAADALLAEADERASRDEFDAALAALEHLREGWRDHPGLPERLERVRAERRADEQMEEVLAAVTRAERAERPLDGLQALDQARPNERFAERFRQARERLQAQLARLDQNPPQISMAGATELSFEKGETVTIPLRITDDQGVVSTKAWARPEGGRFTQLSLRSLGGSDYELEIRPDLHQNKSIDFYVTAADHSGHESSLGTLQRPQKVKKKGWLSKLRGKDG